MKELKQEDYPLSIVEDLGMLNATDKSPNKKRFAKFQCSMCATPYKAYVFDVKNGKSTKCKECNVKVRSTTLDNLSTGKKICSVCKVEKPLNDYYNFKAKKDGKSYRCKACDNIAKDKWKAENPERVRESSRNRHVKHLYGMTPEEYKELLEKQDSKCKICGTTDNKGKNFSIDHCHTTNKIRGLLCNQCNRGIGMLGDTSADLQKALDYLLEAEADTH